MNAKQTTLADFPSDIEWAEHVHKPTRIRSFVYQGNKFFTPGDSIKFCRDRGHWEMQVCTLAGYVPVRKGQIVVAPEWDEIYVNQPQVFEQCYKAAEKHEEKVERERELLAAAKALVNDILVSGPLSAIPFTRLVEAIEAYERGKDATS